MDALIPKSRCSASSERVYEQECEGIYTATNVDVVKSQRNSRRQGKFASRSSGVKTHGS